VATTLITGSNKGLGWENPANPSVEEMRTVFATNVFAVVPCLHAFLPLLGQRNAAWW
jgi:NAD(P)-dependent dehydrogenase (short-subunit alcohol dehydrogenase family)